VIALCLHIGKSAADEDGESAPGSVNIHIDAPLIVSWIDREDYY